MFPSTYLLGTQKVGIAQESDDAAKIVRPVIQWSAMRIGGFMVATEIPTGDHQAVFSNQGGTRIGGIVNVLPSVEVIPLIMIEEEPSVSDEE